MIEFKGYLTGISQKYFCNQIVKLQQKFMAVTFVIGFVILYTVFCLLFDIIVEPIVIFINLILVVLALMLPKIQTKKEKEKITPQRVYIENDIIISQSNALVESRYIEDVKEVRDYGEFYYFVFAFNKYSYRFVCQKDLLAQGTLEDFEALFAGKMKKM